LYGPGEPAQVGGVCFDSLADVVDDGPAEADQGVRDD
jgi:hypothetical protein